jgi:hypothetical protein
MRCSVLTLLVLSAACGGAAPSTPSSSADVRPEAGQTPDALCLSIPGCEEARATASGPTEAVWRVEIMRTASGAVRIARTEPFRAAKDIGVPLGAMAGPFVLAAVDAAGHVVDAQFIRFPEEIRGEHPDDWGNHHVIPLGGRDLTTVGYLRADVQASRFVVVDGQGREVSGTPAPRAAGGSWQPPPSIARLVDLLSATVTLAAQGRGFTPPAHCGHVLLIEGEADREWARNMAFDSEATLVVPGPTQRAVLEGALGLMTPLLCHGIGRVAFAEVPTQPGLRGAVDRYATGDLLVLNTVDAYSEENLAADPQARVLLMRTLLHEGAHAAEALLNAEGARPGQFSGEWLPPSRALAAQTIDQVRLRKSLDDEWRRTHLSFVQQRWAAAYPGAPDARQARAGWSASQVVEAGSMSRYGTTGQADDIAEMVAWIYSAPHFRAGGIPDGARQTEDFACQEFRAHGEHNVPSRLAAAYTKVLFLQDLGLVKPADVQQCLGSVGLPHDAQGFTIWQDGARLTTFDRGLKASIGTRRGRRMFEMLAEGQARFDGKSYPATARLTLDLGPASAPVDEVAWPRGVYPLSLPGTSGFQVQLDGADAGNFDVHEGFALVAEASNTRIAGSVFISVGFRFNAPMPVPQRFDPTLVMRFLIEK